MSLNGTTSDTPEKQKVKSEKISQWRFCVAPMMESESWRRKLLR